MRHLPVRIFLVFFLYIFFIMVLEGLCSSEVTDEAQRIDDVINKVIAAYGGKEVIEGIHSLHAKGEIEALMLRDHGTYELYFKRDRKLRVETKYERSSELRILNGDKAYRSTDALPMEEVYGPRYFSMVYQYKHLDILRGLIEGTYQIQAAGKSIVNDTAVEVFELHDKEGTVMDLYISDSNALIMKVTGYFSAGNKKTSLSSEFADFKKVGGSLFPFRITNYAGGLQIAQTVINNYSLNPDLSDSLFSLRIIHSL